MIRQNRDTLYSAAVVDISQGATLTIPDSAGRYLSVMPINQDGYVNSVFYDPGEYRVSTAEFDIDYLLLAVRVLADPTDPADIAAANALQDKDPASGRRARLDRPRPQILDGNWTSPPCRAPDQSAAPPWLQFGAGQTSSHRFSQVTGRQLASVQMRPADGRAGISLRPPAR